MKRFLNMASIMALVLCVSVLVSMSDAVLAQGHGDGHSRGHGIRISDPDHGGGHFGDGFCTQLTDEQKEAVREKIKELREQGATREEVHAAVAELFEGWDIEIPERSGGHPGNRANLTDEQRKTLQATIQELRDQGAPREEIHAAVAALFEGWGIEMPEKRGGRLGIRANLNDEQQETLRATIQELRDQGATRMEIRAAVDAKFEEWGIEKPDRRGDFWNDLTDAQKETLEAMIEEMKSKEASREDIRAAITEKLAEWGIEMPERPDRRHGFHRGGHDRAGFWALLTDEQKVIVREMIQEMRGSGATRMEIRAAIAEQLEEWGVEPPEGRDGKDSSGRDKGKAKIKARNYPNPFNPETKISYTLEGPEFVTLNIYNTQGQLIRTLVNEQQQAGTFTLHWDGRDENGQQAVSGVYFYRIDAGEQSLTQRMILMK